MKSPYPEVSTKNPFFYVTITGVDLSAITDLSDVNLQVYRVQRSDTPLNPVDHIPLERKKNRLTFVIDAAVFAQDGGRYQADIYILGALVGSTYFVYDKPDVVLTGSANV